MWRVKQRERELRRKSTTNHTVQTNVCSLTLSAYETGIIRRRRCSARLSSSSSYRALSDKILCMQSTHTPHAPTHTHTHKWFLAEDLNARLDTRNSQPSMSIGFVFFFSATGCCCCCWLLDFLLNKRWILCGGSLFNQCERTNDDTGHGPSRVKMLMMLLLLFGCCCCWWELELDTMMLYMYLWLIGCCFCWLVLTLLRKRTATGRPSSSRTDPWPQTRRIQEWRTRTTAAWATGCAHNRWSRNRTRIRYRLLHDWQRWYGVR